MWLSDKTEAGSAEEEMSHKRLAYDEISGRSPASDSLTDENNKAVENIQPLSKNYFQSNAY